MGKTSSQQAKDYELLVQEVYQALVKQDAIANVTVQHDVKVKGKTGLPHQIDVFWEFSIAGIRHRVCVECKNYTSAIKKAQVAGFSRILEDLDNAKGIMVTTKGFQSGAQTLAQADGIRLVLLQRLLRRIDFAITVRGCQVSGWTPIFDPEAEPAMQAGHSGQQIIVAPLEGLENEVFLLDETGAPKISFLELRQTIGESAVADGYHRVPLEGCYLATNSGLLKVAAIGCTVLRFEDERHCSVGGDHIARIVIKGLTDDGTDKFFHGDGSILDVKVLPGHGDD